MVSSISDRLFLFLGAFLVVSVQASDVLACASCTGATPEPVRQAYNYSTAWLSLVPLIFMGSVVYFFYRAIKRGNAEEQQ